MTAYIYKVRRGYYSLKIKKMISAHEKSYEKLVKIRDKFIEDIQVYNSKFIREHTNYFYVKVFHKYKRFQKTTLLESELSKEKQRKLAFKVAENYINSELTNPENFAIYF